MSQFPKLYGYASTGKVKEWWVTVDGAEVTVHHGQLGGKITTRTTTSKPKNVGRSNATTGPEQALKDAESKWKKQLDKNYHENLEYATPLQNPMLAHDYRKQGHRIKFPCSCQPKLDGVRCLITREDGQFKFKSRGNKEYPVIQEIADELGPIFDDHSDGFMLDGELYIHGEPLQNIVGAVKKHKELTSKVEFHIFDYIKGDGANEPNWKYRMRYLLGMEKCKAYPRSRVFFVQNFMMDDKHELNHAHSLCIKAGYEGIMLRNLDGLYKLNTRSADLQKYKCFYDSEYLCTGVTKDKDGFGVLVLVTSEGLEFKAAWKGSHEERKAIAENPEVYIGKYVTVQFQSLTEAGIPQFPISIALREVGKDGRPIE